MTSIPLESWRLAKGLTYEELGRRLGVHTATAHRWCVGEQSPTVRKLPRLVKATGLTVAQLRPVHADRSAA